VQWLLIFGAVTQLVLPTWRSETRVRCRFKSGRGRSVEIVVPWTLCRGHGVFL